MVIVFKGISKFVIGCRMLNLMIRYGAFRYLLLLYFIFLMAPEVVLAQRNLSVEKSGYSYNEHRVALVIGNSAYSTAPLKNPVNDAKAMASKLKAVGFDVLLKENIKVKQIGKTLMEFQSMLKPGSVALIFYAGHGLQIKGVNYLPAVDAEISSELDVTLQSIELSKMLSLLEESKTSMNLVFLDACRNNPFARSFRSASSGLARVEAPSGTLISYATRPGSIAADGDGQNGLYTSQLIQQIELRDVPIETVLKRVTAGVKRISKGAQEPWMEGSIEGDFYFRTTSPEQRIAEQKTAEQQIAQQRIAEQIAAEKKAAERRTAEQRDAEQKLAAQRAAEQRVAEQREAEQRMDKQRISEQDVSIQKKSGTKVAHTSVPGNVSSSGSIFPTKGTRYSYQMRQLNKSWVDSYTVLGEGVYEGKKVYRVSIDSKNGLMLYDLGTGNWMKTIVNGNTEAVATPYEDIIRHPLAAGKSYSSQYYWSHMTDSGYIYAGVIVKDMEKIKVPAGTYNAYPMMAELKYDSTRNDARRRTKKIWFSPDLNIAIKIEDYDPIRSITTHAELLKYSVE